MKTQRLHFLDFIRGVLLIIMVVYHYFFNLYYFFNLPIELNSFPINLIPPIFSSCFIFVSGYSLNLSKNPRKRGAYVLFWGIIITIVTFIITPEAPIYFGILHCIGVMMILGSFLKKYPDNYLFIFIFLIFIFSLISRNYYPNHNYLLFLGITSGSFASLDFYPLIPHGAYFLLGVLFGRKKKPNFLFKMPENKIGEVITLLGKNSLKVYLLHQPLFFLISFIIGKL